MSIFERSMCSLREDAIEFAGRISDIAQRLSNARLILSRLTRSETSLLQHRLHSPRLKLFPLTR